MSQLERARHEALMMKERIRAQLGDDDEAMLSAIESETDFNETVIAVARKIKEDEAFITALNIRMAELKARKERFEHRIEVSRDAIANAMLSVGQTKIEAEDMTLSARVGAQGVKIVSEDMLPDFAWKETIVRKVDLAGIKERVKGGEFVAGIVKTNGVPIVTIRCS